MKIGSQRLSQQIIKYNPELEAVTEHVNIFYKTKFKKKLQCHPWYMHSRKNVHYMNMLLSNKREYKYKINTVPLNGALARHFGTPVNHIMPTFQFLSEKHLEFFDKLEFYLSGKLQKILMITEEDNQKSYFFPL